MVKASAVAGDALGFHVAQGAVIQGSTLTSGDKPLADKHLALATESESQLTSLAQFVQVVPVPVPERAALAGSVWLAVPGTVNKVMVPLGLVFY